MPARDGPLAAELDAGQAAYGDAPIWLSKGQVDGVRVDDTKDKAGTLRTRTLSIESLALCNKGYSTRHPSDFVRLLQASFEQPSQATIQASF